MKSIAEFREDTRDWLEANCPQEMRNLSFHWEDAHLVYSKPEAGVWLEKMAEKGWVAPTWPSEYGGGGLDSEHAQVLSEEMKRLSAIRPEPSAGRRSSARPIRGARTSTAAFLL